MQEADGGCVDLRPRELIVCSISIDGATVNATSNIDRAMERWRRMRHDIWLPVAAIEIDRATFRRVFSISPLPRLLEMDRAAEVFGRNPIPRPLARHLRSQLRRLGNDVVPLLEEWRRAVEAAKGVVASDLSRAQAFLSEPEQAEWRFIAV